MSEDRIADRDGLYKYVATQLGKNKKPEDVARMMAESGHFSWSEADEIVKEVQEKHKGRIAARRAPFMFIFSLGILGGGAFLIYRYTYPYFFLDVMPVLSARAIGLALAGIGMVVGGLFGLVSTIWSLLR